MLETAGVEEKLVRVALPNTNTFQQESKCSAQEAAGSRLV